MSDSWKKKSDYWKKKAEGLDSETKKTTSQSYWENKLAELDKEKEQHDKIVSEITEKKKTTVKNEDDEDEGLLDFFKKGVFEDGYDFGDITKTILGTVGDAGLNVLKGAAGLGEGLVDLAGYGVAGVADFAGKLTGTGVGEEYADDLRKKLSTNYIDNKLKPAENYLDQYSILSRTSDSIMQGVGQVGTILLTGGLAGGAGLSATAATTGAMGLSGMGSGIGQAYQDGASDGEAVAYGAIAGASDALTELMFGGLGKAVKATGLSHGAFGLDDMLAKKVSKMFSSQLMKNAAEFGIKASGEGVEEVVAGIAQALGKKLTYMEEAELAELLKDENLLEQFVVGAVTSGITQAPSVVKATKRGTDFVTGLNQDEQAVIKKEVENRIAEQEQDGKKLTAKEKAAIEEQVVRDLDRGYISTDVIDEIVGGDTYASYKNSVEQEDALFKEYEDLGNTQNPTLAQQYRYGELHNRVQTIKDTDLRSKRKAALDEQIAQRVGGTRLAESYNERARRGQAFEADLTKYDTKQQAVIQKAIDSGVLNNTNRTHDFVDMVAKISADKGVLFDFTNNEKLKNSGFAVDGKFVNGYFDKQSGTIGVNLNSAKALNTIVGHEITHVLEGTELYNELQTVAIEYAKAKGDYQGRIEALNKLYDADVVDSELTADLVGDYLFTDEDFIKKLSTENRNVFQKVFDEVKYLLKVVTAGSKEAKQLEKVKHAFEKAYRENGKAQGDTQYSLTPVEAVQPKSDKWNRTHDTAEAMAKFPNMWNVAAEESEARNPTQITSTVKSYRKIYDHLKSEGFNGTILDASSGLGYGTKAGIEEYGFKVDDIEPYPDKGYSPKYQDYSTLDKKYDVIISNAVLNVLPQDQRDALTVKMGELLNDGGRMFINVRGKDVEKLAKTGKNIHLGNMEWIETVKGSYQKGFTRPELIAYLEDALGDGFTVKPTKFGSTTVVVTKEGGVKYSLSTDSDGRQLSNEQRDYFKDSKVVDENGNLKVVYHGTRKADFTVFNRNVTYFTDSKEMADSYAPNSEMFEGYVNITKPFEVDAQGERWSRIPIDDETKDFLQEYGASVFEEDGEWRTTPADLASAIEEAVDNGDMDYDGIIIRNIDDTGSYYKGKDSHIATDYIVFNSNQFKNATNINPTADKDIRFSLSSEVEETDRLVAIHNKSASGVMRMLERGGVPFPSIAIKKAGTGHEGFGEYSIVFPRETIDPEFSKWNKLYSNDAWSPTEPRTEYDVGDTYKYQKAFESMVGSDVYNALRGSSYLYSDNLEQRLSNRGGNVFEAVKDLEVVKYGYLQSIGQRPEIARKQKKLDGFGRYTNEQLLAIFDKIDGDLIRNATYDSVDVKQQIANVLDDQFMQQLGDDENMVRAFRAAPAYTADDVNVYAIQDAYRQWERNGKAIPTEVSPHELTKVLRTYNVEESDDYRRWVEDVFDGLIKDSGIRNGKDIFTPSGNRRSFKQLHVPATLDNIVKLMRKEQETGVGTFGINLRGAATKTYSTVEDMRADRGRLLTEHIDDAEYDSYMKGFYNRLGDLKDRAAKKKNDWQSRDTAEEVLLEAVRDAKTKATMTSKLRKESQWINFSQELADDLWALKMDVQNMPTPYFESKARRIVYNDEIAALVIPDNAPAKLVNELNRRGIAYKTYEAGNEADRLAKLNSVLDENPDLRFSLSEDGKQRPYGSYNVYGRDVALEQEIAPVQEEAAPVDENAVAVDETAVAVDEPVDELFPDDNAPMSEEYDADRMDSLFYEEAPPEMDAPYYEDYHEGKPAEVKDPFEDRDFYETGKQRSVKAYQYENPEVKPFFTEMAKVMLQDIQDGIKGEKWYNSQVGYEYGNESAWGGTKRQIASDIAELLDYGYTRDQLNEGLRKIIEDDGKENNAVSKRIEFVLNDRLLYGWTDMWGQPMPANPDYIKLLEEKEITEYSKEAFAALTDADAPPVVEDIAPVKQSVEPAPQRTITREGGQMALPLYPDPNNVSPAMGEVQTDGDIAPVFDTESGQQAIMPEEEKPVKLRRKELHANIIDRFKNVFHVNGYELDDVLENAKDLSTFATVDNIPQRVMEKALGYKEGKILSDLTVNQVAQNETKGIQWLNSFTDRKNGLLAQISKQYDIKPGSKESAAAQMYAEGFYVTDSGDIVEYGDRELAKDFPDVRKQAQIKGLAHDPRIRKIYDETLAAINESRVRNAYPEIPRLDNYFLHFRAMNDTFSQLGLPFNPNDIRAKDLPTDLNGVTADLKPGQPFFASAMHRTGKRTSFDLLGGLEQYLNGAKNQIYHIDDIQNLRALRNYIADTYGQANGLEGLDALSEEEQQDRIEQVYSSHLSTFAKFLNEEANVLAGKTALIDRGLEGIIGRRGMTFLDTLNRQVGSNMVGYNVSSSLTNFLSLTQGFAKSNKAAFVKGLAQFAANKVNSIRGVSDGFAEASPVMIRRNGAERFHRTMWQKLSDPGYILMSAVDNVSTELIARAKYNELTSKGMDSQQAHIETDKWVSRLMGDRSLGQQPQLYNSKTLGIVTKFQLEVRNQLDAQFYDTIQDAKLSTEQIENKLLRNAKTAAKVTSTLVQLSVAQHLFGKAFESVAGYNPAFDIISAIIKTFGWDDDEEDEDTVLDNIEEGFFELMGDLPYVSTLTGGRIPIASALPIEQLYKGEDQYGNEKSRLETLSEAAPYYFMPGGYGQLKKTVGGLSMFDDEHPVAGSYTDSGNLRFPVEDTFANRAQAAVFGQWASGNARDYFNDERSALKEKQIQEFLDVGMDIHEYWDYRDALKELNTLEEKADYISGMDLAIAQKNLLINNQANRKEPIDLTNYEDFGSLEEFDFANEYPEKYAFLEENNISYHEYKNGDEYTKEAYDWAMENPEKFAVSKAVSDDYLTYYGYRDDINNIDAKDANGKTVSGLKKERVIDYINSLDIDYGQKIILFKSQYDSKKDRAAYNQDIIDYLNSRSDIPYEEKLTILKELKFTVDSEGNVYWD